MQSVLDNSVIFRVHTPLSGNFLLDIFANAVTPAEYLAGDPMKFKSVCKFRVDCKQLQTVMVPLPECASGEWGPTKATRLFGLTPLTHEDALIFAGKELEVRFRMQRPLTDFLASLHKNGLEDKRLSKHVQHMVQGDLVSIHVIFPEDGQYGLDIYTRDLKAANGTTGSVKKNGVDKQQLLTHCCKYLINVTWRS